MLKDASADNRRYLMVSETSKVSGPALSALALASGLLKGGDEVAIACPAGHLADEASALGLKIFIINGRLGIRGALAKVKGLRQALSEVSQDTPKSVVVVANTINAAYLVKSTRGFDRQTLVAISRASSFSFRDIIRLRSVYKTGRNVKIVAVSPYACGLIEAYTWGLDGNSIGILPNGVDDKVWKLAAPGGRYRPRESCAVIGYVGSYSRAKGFDVFLAAMLLLARKGVRLSALCIGVDESSMELNSARRELVDQLKGIAEITFTGRTNLVLKHLRDVDVALLPSPNESFGRPVLECAALGVPIVCSDNAGHRAMVSHGVSARLFAVGRADLAAAAVEDALENSRLTADMVAVARVQARRYSSVQIAELLREIVSSGSLGDAVNDRWRGYTQRDVSWRSASNALMRMIGGD